jgi:hypothetical protein
MLAVVVSDVEVDGEFQLERRMLGSNPEQLRSLAAWLIEQEVEEVVMESTAQAGGRERCIWHKRNPIADGADAKEISPTPKVW